MPRSITRSIIRHIRIGSSMAARPHRSYRAEASIISRLKSPFWPMTTSSVPPLETARPVGGEIGGGLHSGRARYALLAGTVYMDRIRLYWRTYAVSYQKLLFRTDRYGNLQEGFLLYLSSSLDGSQNETHGASAAILGFQRRPNDRCSHLFQCAKRRAAA